QLIHHYVAAQMQLELRKPNPRPLQQGERVEEMVQMVRRMAPEERQRWLRQFPELVLEVQRKLDPFWIFPEDQKAGANQPRSIAADVEKLLSDNVDQYLAARRQVLGHGPRCIALVAERGRKLPEDSPKRLRLRAVLAELENQAREDQKLRAIEEGMQ